MKLQNILATKGSRVAVIGLAQTLGEAVTELGRLNIGALVVTDAAGQPAGILSERDIIRAIAGDANFAGRPVSAVMTRAVVFGAPQDDVTAVLNTMTQKRFRHLPVLDAGRLVGIVSIGDLVKAQLDTMKGQMDTLETQIIDG